MITVDSDHRTVAVCSSRAVAHLQFFSEIQKERQASASYSIAARCFLMNLNPTDQKGSFWAGTLFFHRGQYFVGIILAPFL